jgi:hypothetical protein
MRRYSKDACHLLAQAEEFRRFKNPPKKYKRAAKEFHGDNTPSGLASRGVS